MPSFLLLWCVLGPYLYSERVASKLAWVFCEEEKQKGATSYFFMPFLDEMYSRAFNKENTVDKIKFNFFL